MTGIVPQTRQAARRLRQEMTPQERQVWARLREVNRMLGTNFRRQAPIGRYIVGFVDLGRRLVVEIGDGRQGSPAEADRDAWLAGQGFRMVRIADAESEAEKVVQAVLDVLGI